MIRKVKFISKNRSGIPLIPKGITLHETATPGAAAENLYQYFNREYVGASAHAFVDWDESIQTVPYSEQAWHAGPTANSRYIGIEMCRPAGHNPELFKKVWDNTAELFAELITRFNLAAEDINTHHEISLKWGETDHTDPVGYLSEYNESIESFRRAVEEKLNGGLSMTQYEELKNSIDSIKNQLSSYKYMDESLNKIAPDAFAALSAAISKGAIAYGEDGFTPGLTSDMIRMIVYMYRAGVFEK